MDEKNTGSKTKPHTGAQGYFVQLEPYTADSDISLIEVWQFLLRYKLMIVSIVFIMTSIAIAVSLLMKPIYRSVVLLVPDSSDNVSSGISALAGQLGGLASLAGLNSAGGYQKEEAIAILKSRSFTRQFIENENLMPILFSELWDSTNQKWNVEEPTDIPTDEDAYKLFNEEVRDVNLVRKSEMVTVSIEWTDRHLAAEWANRLVWHLNQYLRTRDILEAEKNIEFLNLEMAKSNSVELRQGIANLIERQIETVMLANVREQYSLKVLDPAIVSDANKRVRPKRKIIVITTFIVAFLIAILLAIARYQFESFKSRRSNTRS